MICRKCDVLLQNCAGWDLSVIWIRNLQLALEYLKFEEIEK